MRKILIILTAFMLFLASIFLCVGCYLLQNDVGRFSDMSRNNGKIAIFNTLFIQKVLKSQGEVSLEDRLKLENAVYDIGDSQIVDEWHSFLASQTEQEAQIGVLDLLTMLSNKIAY